MPNMATVLEAMVEPDIPFLNQMQLRLPNLLIDTDANELIPMTVDPFMTDDIVKQISQDESPNPVNEPDEMYQNHTAVQDMPLDNMWGEARTVNNATYNNFQQAEDVDFDKVLAAEAENQLEDIEQVQNPDDGFVNNPYGEPDIEFIPMPEPAIPPDMIAPLMDIGGHWSAIGGYTPRENPMSPEISSSSPSPPQETQDPTAMVAIEGNGAVQTQSDDDGPASTQVSSSGIGMVGGGDSIHRNMRQTSLLGRIPKYAKHLCHRVHRPGVTRRHRSHTKLQKVKAQVMQLIKQAPGGCIFMHDLLRNYRRRYRRSLKFENRVYSSPIRMLIDMGMKVLVTRPLGLRGDFMFSLAPPAIQGTIDLTGLEPDTLRPPTYIQLMDTIPLIRQEAYPRGRMLLANIGSINSPSDFAFVKCGKQNHKILETMSAEMMAYYSHEGSEEMPPEAIRVNHHCSVTYGGIWHRARIIDIVDPYRVKVRHIDYGSEDIVPSQDIRPLLCKWAELPAQAIQARIPNIGPPTNGGNLWPGDSIEAFKALVLNKFLFIFIINVDNNQTTPVAEVAIVDTSYSEDQLIDTELIKLGLADDLRTGPRRCQRRIA